MKTSADLCGWGFGDQDADVEVARYSLKTTHREDLSILLPLEKQQKINQVRTPVIIVFKKWGQKLRAAQILENSAELEKNK